MNPHCTTYVHDDVDVHDQELLSKIEGYFTYRHPETNKDFLAQLPKLRVVSNFGVGVDHIDVLATQQQKIDIENLHKNSLT